MQTGSKAITAADLSDRLERLRAEFEENGDTKGAFEALYSLEKKFRLEDDATSTALIATEIIRLAWRSGGVPALVEHLRLISRRRAQLKQAIASAVQEGMRCLDAVTEVDRKRELLEALRDVSMGKLYLELERARLTKMLAEIKESAGDVAGAANVLNDLQIETFGTMERAEKWRFMLEQIRLCLELEDTVRAQIIANKFTARTLVDEEFKKSPAKTEYYTLMIRLFRMQQRLKAADDSRYLDIAKAYLSLGDEFLGHAVLYVILTPRNNEQHDLLHRLAQRDRLRDRKTSLHVYGELLSLFQVEELIRWPIFVQSYRKVLETEHPDLNWLALQRRIHEHNLRVIAKYYTRIHLARLASFMEADQDDVENMLCEEITSGRVWGRIDRVDGIVTFRRERRPEKIISEWARNVDNVLAAVDRLDELVNKERQQRGMPTIGSR
ncbi:26S proteasome non-ATPase regulatory subunit 12 [Cyanidiococcus yangmingshanensis]|uniref:26S proteasome non-ATPase regulatory subunit 12 n=1 Tax=Cyanidiococcus yangmingshanensis TaxID=2690220 RepID=A0A7J7ICQ3_9RHOD|nr:26S proteasome non-ATPase regulatory subunit 12 [Cyanidiococcus yangmingshanensis]